MIQDRATSEENFSRFIERVRESREIYGLQSPDAGWAVCPSNEEEGASVMVFWSDRAYSARHQKDDWKTYTPCAIPLDEFIDAWLKGMHEDGFLVGPNWHTNLCGLELEPIEVARRLSAESNGPTSRSTQ